MGTNYYCYPKYTNEQKLGLIKKISNDEAVTSNDIKERIHIGKSSAGWRFLFNPTIIENLNSLDGLKTFLENSIIYDEYKGELPNKDFWEMVGAKEAYKYEQDEHHEIKWGLWFSKHFDFS